MFFLEFTYWLSHHCEVSLCVGGADPQENFTHIIVITTNIFLLIRKRSQYTLFPVLTHDHVNTSWEIRSSYFDLAEIDSTWLYVKPNKDMWSKSSVWITFISKISIMVYINKPKYMIHHTISKTHCWYPSGVEAWVGSHLSQALFRLSTDHLIPVNINHESTRSASSNIIYSYIHVNLYYRYSAARKIVASNNLASPSFYF